MNNIKFTDAQQTRGVCRFNVLLTVRHDIYAYNMNQQDAPFTVNLFQ